MKKAKYSFLVLFLMSCSFVVNAQIYTETFHRTFGIPDTGAPLNNVNWAKGAGTFGEIRSGLGSITVEQRGVELYSHTNNFSDYSAPNGNAFSQFIRDYVDLSDDVIEVIAGQEFSISAVGMGDLVPWANGVAFVDWDGNGAFDDHPTDEYNVYGFSQADKVEYAGVSASPLNIKWTFTAPNFTEERLVRVRIRFDEGVNETIACKKNGIADWANKSGTENGIPEVTLSQVSETLFQNFWTMAIYRFLPTANGTRGCGSDIMLKIVPDPYSGITPQPKETIAGAGNVAAACQTSQGTAISDAAGFVAFMSATSGNYYLANDITLTSLPVSQTTFNGTFDGNGHTITFSSNATATFNGTSKDDCFYPYGLTDKAIGENILHTNNVTLNFDKTNYPNRAIAGGFCGVLAKNSTIKNVKLVYAADATYKNNATEAPIFGLVAGINKGRIENVSVDVQAGKTVMLQNAGSPTASAFGGITGVLYLGIVKHCAVNIDGTMKHEGASAMQETLTSAFIGRLQAGIVSNVKFSGSGTMYANSSAVSYVRNYMGGIAGMTHTPQGEFCGNQDFDKQLKSWGYDNGTVGLDVNNVIISYTGAMNMSSAADNGNYAYHCRGLLFAEAHDTIVVPNLITQNVAPTIEKEAPVDASLTDIPLISKTKGLYNALVPNGETSVAAHNTDPRLMGHLYLYKDARFNANSNKGDKFTNVNVADAEVDWAYEYDPNTCSYYSTPYAVATYTGTNANVQGIESASANVSDLGSAMVKIDPQPADVASPSWTWSETASPVTPDTDAPVCGGGGGETTLPLLTTYCTPGNQNVAPNGQRTLGNFIINGTTIAINETSADNSASYRGYKNTIANAIEVEKGKTFTITGASNYSWIHVTAFVDWNHDGVFEKIGRSPNSDAGGAASFTVTVPNDAAVAYTPLRLMLAWLDVNNACDFNDKENPNVAVDIVLKVIESATPTYPTYCAGTAPNNGDGDHYGINGGYIKVNGTQVFDFTHTASIQDFSASKIINVCSGDNITIGVNGGQHLAWSQAIAYFDWNKDGAWDENSEAYEIFNNDLNTNGAYREKTITVPTISDGVFKMRICSGEAPAHNSLGGGPCQAKKRGKLSTFGVNVACAAAPTPGDGCAYVANFGDVYAGEVATYDIKLGAGSGAALNPEVPDDEYTLNYDDATGILTVTYNVPATPGAVAVDSIGGITKGGVVYRIAVSATVKAAPTVTFRMSDAGGGALSLDMGKTTFIETRELAPYKGELLTAVPIGPTHIVGWYVSTDGGTSWTDVGHANPDYTYTGADDAIVEVRFDFDDFEGNFGNSRFTDNSNVPFYISAISTTDGIVNVNATNVFTDATVAGGSAHLRYMENQRLQTLHKSLKTLTHNVTVTVQNANKIPADARLMCFVDYNMNNYFDFASSADGLASALSENGELVFVADPNDTEATQTFTFTISNAGIDQFGKTRMRFMVATYVDMFGLGPVNQYGNYQPRFDTDGDGIADSNLPLNDNNGSLYTPNDQCRLENYVNVADVTFEVVAFVRYNDKYVIKNGESVRMKNLYIEAMEDATGFHAGQIVFDKTAPYGSLIIEGNIIIRRRIYPDKWHDLSFPIEMQGVGGKDGICAVGANGALGKLPATGKHLVYEFDPAGRNQTGGYNGGTTLSSDANFQANKFYEFAADVPDGFTANNAGDGIDSENSYWIQFHSVDTGFVITPSAAKTATLSYTRDEDAPEYWNRNVFTLYNPFLSNINVKEITSSVGWENITWWNAVQNRYTGVSAAEKRDMPPHFGYWIQFTEGIGSGAPISIVLGDASRNDYPYASDNDRVVNFAARIAAQAPTFDTPDSYTLGIDAAENASNETAVSSTIVTLTDEGSIDNFRAGYDMPASFAAADAEVPEIWTKAGESNMMFNDVQRADEVVVPVGIRIKEAGEYAVRLTHTNDTTSLVQLRDKETGAIVDLQSDGEESSYLFLADEGDANRFELVISKAPQMVTDLEFVETLQGEGEAQVYVIGDNLCLKNIAMGYSVSVCDVLGREYLRTLVTEADMKVLLPAMRGVYIVNILDKQNISVQSVKVTK